MHAAGGNLNDSESERKPSNARLLDNTLPFLRAPWQITAYFGYKATRHPSPTKNVRTTYRFGITPNKTFSNIHVPAELKTTGFLTMSELQLTMEPPHLTDS